MIIREEVKDLFTVDSTYYLAQCISADFGMGRGIAIAFNDHFDMKNKLIAKYGRRAPRCPTCLLYDHVFNLVTKQRYWGKPTYDTMRHALVEMRDYVRELNIKKIAMPRIGCGLDKLDWVRVKELIEEVFANVDVEILICTPLVLSWSF